MTQDADIGARLRALHHGKDAFIIPNPWDAGSARMLAALGFKALATTSAGHAFSLGRVDGKVSRAEALAHCRMMVEATDLPVSADLENCFGDSPEAVAATVRDAAATGLAGCSIEDYSGDPDKSIYDFGLAVERVRAAAEAARGAGRDFVLTARAENFLRGRTDLADTIARLQAFSEAGADVLYAPALKDLAMIAEVCRCLDKPFNALMGIAGATFTVAELSAAGVKRISVGSALARLAYGSLVRAAREMAGDGSFGFVDDAAATAEINKLLVP